MSAPFDYNTSVPNPPNDPADDVGAMQNNTASIAGLIAVDHVGFNNNNGGYHDQVSFAINQTAPGLGLGVAELYANLANSNSWPFWQNSLGSIQLAGRNFLATNGYITLPSQGSSPLIAQWGVVHSAGSTFQNGDFASVAFATNNIAFPNNCFIVLTTLVYQSSIPIIPGEIANICIDWTTLSKTSFTWTYPQNSNQYNRFFWLALGN